MASSESYPLRLVATTETLPLQATNRVYQIAFHDFDLDGSDEIIRLGLDHAGNLEFLEVDQAKNRQNIDEVPLSGTLASNWFIGSYDEDRGDEVIVPMYKSDSLFYYHVEVDIPDSVWIQERRFVASGKPRFHNGEMR